MGLPWLWIGGLLTTAVVTHQVLKPRLPIYKVSPLLGLPRLLYDKEKGQVCLGMPMSISMENENFMEIDIYGLTFDLFYMNHDGALLHVADIRDHNQASSHDARHTAKSAALWQVPSRSNFTIDDMLYISMDSGLIWNLLGNVRFYSSLWKGSGSFWLPTTGVAHVKAATNVRPGVAATISIICDNLVENMVVQGLSCVLHNAQPGWADMKWAVSNMRVHALTKLRANLEGVVVGGHHASFSISPSASSILSLSSKHKLAFLQFPYH